MAIALENSVRTNLVALQSITKGLARTEERLASGKKVNSIIDNPSSFFAARSLNDRAGRLNSRLDGMSNSIQTLNAANAGIDAIRALLANARALANDAITKGSAADRRELGEQFNEVLEQAYEIATDSSYNGINLLQQNQRMTIEFADKNSDSTLNVRGLDIQGADGNGVSEVTAQNRITKAATPSAGSVSAVASQAFVSTAPATNSMGSIATIASQASHAFFAGTVSQASQGSLAIPPQSSVGSVNAQGSQASVASFAGIAQQASVGSVASRASQANIFSRAAAASAGSVGAVNQTFTQKFALSLQVDERQPQKTIGLRKHGVNTPGGLGNHHVDFGARNSTDLLGEITREIDAFDEALSTQAARISTNLNIIKVREDFTEALINTLEAGADKLVLADMNKEGANLITLQTRHALAIQSLSISSSQTQQILNLLI